MTKIRSRDKEYNNDRRRRSSSNEKHSKKYVKAEKSQHKYQHSRRSSSPDNKNRNEYRYEEDKKRSHPYQRARDSSVDRKDYKNRNSQSKSSRYDDFKEPKNKYNHRSEQKNFTKHERHQKRNNTDDGKSYDWGKKETDKSPSPPKPIDKEKPNFTLSGALTEDTNKVNDIVIKYSEPPEARKPKRRWRLYPFKGETPLPTLHIHRQSAFLIGRERKVVDLAVDHPSCSKQHAALQYRLLPYTRVDGTQSRRVRLYLIDLESANGTFLNNKKIDPRKYYELFEKDVIKFGFSTREYVLLHENSKDEAEDDDIGIDIKEEP